tara:strand:+ start:338 stop:586 length:249 start_codon:yes stop_codon:yes gene_type:complete
LDFFAFVDGCCLSVLVDPSFFAAFEDTGQSLHHFKLVFNVMDVNFVQVRADQHIGMNDIVNLVGEQRKSLLSAMDHWQSLRW